MSARVEVGSLASAGLKLATVEAAQQRSKTEVEARFRNFDQRNLVAPLRDVHTELAHPLQSHSATEARCQAALAAQCEWDSWLTQRESLTDDIKRGQECLQQVRKELATLRALLQEWPGFERTCGNNPLFDYVHHIVAHERVEQFLPAWLKGREEQLAALTRKMQACARQNGLEHLV
jgi:hypothetical protein